MTEAIDQGAAEAVKLAAELTDEQIVERVRAGEQRLFEVLMRRHNPQVYRAARSILHDDGEAEDVMQDAYVRAYEHLAEFEGRSRFSTWVTRIAIHEALARARRSKRYDTLDAGAEGPSMPAAAAANPEQQTSDGEMRRLLQNAVEALPEEFRSVFVLRAVHGMNGAEVADCLGLEEATVKTRLFRARGRLRDLLEAAGGAAVGAVYDFHLSRCDRVVAGVFKRLAKVRSGA
ncbi:MAG TPA: RNA polymerase sigma factor [Myxococcales bacterium]|nr:RNA polymerase sigma factor [Myxococcales bacterium]